MASRAFLLSAASLVLFAGTAFAQDWSTDDLAFLQGTWCGETDGGFAEEVWSEPRSGTMLGMFRWLTAKGDPRVYEILAISHEGDEVLLRLRHFSAAMVAWEERDEPIEMRLDELEVDRASFTNRSDAGRLERYVFERTGENALRIDIHFRAESGAAPLHFDLTNEPCPR